jgi:hypothetical protein
MNLLDFILSNPVIDVVSRLFSATRAKANSFSQRFGHRFSQLFSQQFSQLRAA